MCWKTRREQMKSNVPATDRQSSPVSTKAVFRRPPSSACRRACASIVGAMSQATTDPERRARGRVSRPAPHPKSSTRARRSSWPSTEGNASSSIAMSFSPVSKNAAVAHALPATSRTPSFVRTAKYGSRRASSSQSVASRFIVAVSIHARNEVAGAKPTLRGWAQVPAGGHR